MSRRKVLLVSLLALLLLPLAGIVGLRLLEPDCQDEGCPALNALEEYRPLEPPHVYDRQGEMVGHLSGPRRVVVPMERIPPRVRDAFIAVEDRRFRDHDGVDVRGAVRAFFANVGERRLLEGASTITMQLVRNAYEAEVSEYSRWRRKLTEVALARAVERRLSKDEILGLYLNQIYLGDGVYGVETAARHYFGRSVADVTLAEAALLVGLAKNPEGYNPRLHPERARERRNLVLGVLEERGVADPAEAREAMDAPVDVRRTPPDWGANAYYLSAVRRELRRLFPDPQDRAGLRVHTGLDTGLQAAAQQELREQIEAIEAGSYGRYAHTVAEGELAPVTGSDSPYLQGMVVAMDPGTGAVLALVGGRDYQHSEFDRAVQALRQPGSAFKPILYSAALSRGVLLSDVVETTPVAVRQAGAPVWEPNDLAEGDAMTVRQALVRSSNSAAVRVGQTVGTEEVARRARELGISTPIPAYPSIFLGAAEVVPIELTAAYAAFGNGGRRITPHLITRIESPDGEVVWSARVESQPALDPAVAFLTLDVLRGVVDHGTGWRVRREGYRGPAAGKTGTTDEGRDVWFVGMTPDLVMSVWLGFDRPRPIVAGASGGTLAAPIWSRVAQTRPAPASLPESWRPTSDVVVALVDSGTGYLAGEACPDDVLVEEYFLRGTAPVVRCPVHEQDLFHRLLRGLKRAVGG